MSGIVTITRLTVKIGGFDSLNLSTALTACK
jgi:hypothetical protein